MQNFSPSDQALLGTELVKTRHDDELTPQAKMRATIVQLAKYLGSDLVECVLTNAHEGVRAADGHAFTPTLRAMDAIHLATVLTPARRRLNHGRQNATPWRRYDAPAKPT
jgi:hypothetical protein